MVTETEFRERLEAVQRRIKAACTVCGREVATVELMPVTKRHPAAVVEMAAAAGLRCVGENRVQEAAGKRGEAGKAGVRWELIGPLQSNKARLALETVERIQTVDRIKLVRVLDRLSGELGRGAGGSAILLQVNTGEDPAKHGCSEEDAEGLLEAALSAPHLRVEGLMTIGPLSTEEAVVRRTFARLRQLRDRLAEGFGIPLDVLSMGMTGDMEWAIEEGSTLVRVGTALFGEREG